MPSYTIPSGFITPADARTMSANEKSKADAQNALYGNDPQATPQNPTVPGTTTQIWISNYDDIGKTDNQLPKQGTAPFA